MALALSLNVLRFWHFRSKNGRTQVHVIACQQFGKSGLHTCGCPRMFAAATVDSYFGMLRALFNDIGRRFFQNPCDLTVVKSWVKACAKEQQLHHVPIMQARLIFSTHLRLLFKEIMFRIASLPPGSPFLPSRFLLRDWAFFLIQWFSGDRPGNLGSRFGEGGGEVGGRLSLIPSHRRQNDSVCRRLNLGCVGCGWPVDTPIYCPSLIIEGELECVMSR